MPQIKVHEKALAHLTKGLYRSPASAVRELVSNAWDAGATTVEVFTSPPSFNRIVVKDNGSGFKKAEFERLMNHGIGNSTKRSATGESLEPAKNNRPTLGRLGIGLMGVAQICSRFRVVSRPPRGEHFAAEVRILDHLRRHLDSEAADAVETAPPVRPGKKGDVKAVYIGSWEWADPGPDDGHRGTQVIVTHPLSSFRNSFVSTLRPVAEGIEEHEDQMSNRLDDLAPPSPSEVDAAIPPLEWGKLIEEAGKKESVAMRGAYWQFLWELGTSCPVRYVSDAAVPAKAIAADQRRLSAYDFRVFVDSRELFKPVVLDPAWKHGYTVERFEQDLSHVSGLSLKCHGYLAVHEGTQLRPSEIRGVLVRVKDIAVGGYDASLLDWQTNQGPRSRWLTGEVFVDEGLEDAINVDRDSFNQFHPEYLAIQNVVHKQLRKTFKKSYPKIEKRADTRRHERRDERLDALSAAAELAAGGKPVTLTRGRQGSAATPVQVTKSQIKLRVADPGELKTRKSRRELASSILAIFDIAQATGKTPEQRRTLFQEALLKILRKL
jgi:hypothetical protein